MTTLTLEAIKAEQNRIGDMIAAFEAQAAQAPSFFEYQGERITLAPGELYVGTIISADSSKNHHVILLPGDMDDIKWDAAMAWAKSIGGDLPDRVEQSLLFATMKDQFEEAAYWSNMQHAWASGSAWFQLFSYGHQYDCVKGAELRARAVRRSIIQ